MVVPQVGWVRGCEVVFGPHTSTIDGSGATKRGLRDRTRKAGDRFTPRKVRRGKGESAGGGRGQPPPQPGFSSRVARRSVPCHHERRAGRRPAPGGPTSGRKWEPWPVRDTPSG